MAYVALVSVIVVVGWCPKSHHEVVTIWVRTLPFAVFGLVFIGCARGCLLLTAGDCSVGVVCVLVLYLGSLVGVWFVVIVLVVVLVFVVAFQS